MIFKNLFCGASVVAASSITSSALKTRLKFQSMAGNIQMAGGKKGNYYLQRCKLYIWRLEKENTMEVTIFKTGL